MFGLVTGLVVCFGVRATLGRFGSPGCDKLALGVVVKGQGVPTRDDECSMVSGSLCSGCDLWPSAAAGLGRPPVTYPGRRSIIIGMVHWPLQISCEQKSSTLGCVIEDCEVSSFISWGPKALGVLVVVDQQNKIGFRATDFYFAAPLVESLPFR